MAFNFRVKKIITRPIIKLEKGVEYYFLVQSEAFIGKDIKKAVKFDSDGKPLPPEPPATLMNVIQLDTGVEGQIIVPKVMQDLLIENYPDRNYVGLSFSVKLTMVPNKRYNLVTLNEIEASEAPLSPEQKAAAQTNAETQAAAEGERAAKAAAEEKAAREKGKGKK